MYYASQDGTARDRRRLCGEMWPRFIEVCDQLSLGTGTRLLVIGDPNLRSYYRWNQLTREGRTFQAPSCAELICSVIDVLEELLCQAPTDQASHRLRVSLDRAPFRGKTPFELLLRANPRTNWALWCILHHPDEGTLLVAKMKADARQLGMTFF